MNKLAYLALILLATACVEEDLPDEDPIDEAFLDESGKEDAYGVSDKSPEGLGILQLVNLAGYHDLQKIGLGENAFRALWNYRESEKKRFNGLADLDRLPYIGRGSILKILAFAQANGYVSPNPFEPTACAGSPMTLARLQEVTQNGTKKFPVGATWTRERTCSGALGCGAWSTPVKLALPQNSNLTYGSSTPSEVGFMARMYSNVTVSGGRYPDYQSVTDYYWTFKFQTSPFGLVASSMFGNWSASYALSANARINDSQLTFTDHCMRLVGKIKLLDASHAPNGQEREVAFMVQY